MVKEDLKTPADPLDLGAGRIDLTKAGDPGLTFDVVARDFLDAGMNQEADINLNTPSIYVPKLAGTITTTRTATNATDQRVRYRASATAPDGATISVTPRNFTLRPGESVKLTITVNGVKLPADTNPQDPTWYFGQVELDELTGNRDLHLPVGFTKAQGSVSLDTTCDADNDHPAAVDRVEMHRDRYQHRNRRYRGRPEDRGLEQVADHRGDAARRQGRHHRRQAGECRFGRQQARQAGYCTRPEPGTSHSTSWEWHQRPLATSSS